MSISSLLDIASIGKDVASKVTSAKPEDVAVAASLFQKAKSIAERASRYVMEYPVAVTSTIAKADIYLAIAKRIEFDCARFVLLASGLNPIIRNGTIETHINNLMTSYESFSGWNVSVTPATHDAITQAKIYMMNEYTQEAYHSFDDDNYLKSIEKSSYPDKEVYTDDDPQMHGSAPQDPNNPSPKYSGKIVESKMGTNPNVLNDVLKNIGKMAPTIITVKLIIDSAHGKEIDIPLVIKATPQVLNQEDVQHLLLNVNTPGKRLQNFIKLTSGQIRFFKDFILAEEDAEKDALKARTLGTTPLFRQLMSAKNRYKIKNIRDHIPILKRFIGGKNQKDLPMCTVIVTAEELYKAYNLNFEYLLTSKKIIKNIIDTYMLLGFGVVDEIMDRLVLFYAGEDTYYDLQLSEVIKNIKSGKSTVENDLVKSLTKIIDRKF